LNYTRKRRRPDVARPHLPTNNKAILLIRGGLYH